MKIYYKGGWSFDVTPDDNSYLYKRIMGTDTLNITFTCSEKKTIPVGSYCDFLDQRYTLMQPMSVKKNHSKSYSHTLVLEGIQATLLKYKFKNPSDKTLRFIVTAKPTTHLAMLVECLNQHENRWIAGECLDAIEGVVSYNHNSCMEALNVMAQQFNTEWEVEDMFDGTYKIHLRKVEYNKTDPLVLAYGKGKGFLSGLTRTTESSNQMEILYVQGGDQNINYYAYGSKTLGLPKSKYLAYDGKTFYDNYNQTNLPPKELKCNLYVTDAKGEYIKRADRELESGVEASLDCSHIYPKGSGKVGSVTYENVDQPNAINCDFVGIDDVDTGVDYSRLVAQGDNIRIIFQEGMLVGKEFDVNYDHSSRTFKIVPQVIDGMRMPNKTFTPKVGEKYIVLGIVMTKAFICNDNARTGASWEMYREGVRYLYENEKPRFAYRGTVDGIWAKRSWNNIIHKIKLGGYIQFDDSELTEEESGEVLIRMTGIKQSVNNPYSPELEFSNMMAVGGVSSMLKIIESKEVIAESNDRQAFNFTKRRFSDAMETQSLLKDALLDFSAPLNPITVHTMSMLAGDESLQYRFVDFVMQQTTGLNGNVTLTTIPRQATHHIEYRQGEQAGTGTLNVPQGYLQHLTLDVNPDVEGPLAYKYWQLSQTSFSIAKDDKQRYLYARVSKTGNISDISNPTGLWNNFVFVENAIALNSEPGYYHLLVGVLNGDKNGERSYVSLYGFSELLPGRLTTGRIVSSDGQTYFDLDSGTIGGRIVFEERNNKNITLIEGGKINANCINTDKLRASEVVTSGVESRIEINTEGAQNAICIYGSQDMSGAPGAPGSSNERPTLIVDGKDIATLDKFINPQNLPASIAISSSACTYEKTYDKNVNTSLPARGTMEDKTLYLTSVNGFNIASDLSGRLIANIPQLTVTIDAGGQGNSASASDLCSRGSITVTVLLDNKVLGEKSYLFVGRQSPQTLTIPARSLKLGTGNHSLTVEIGGTYDVRALTSGGGNPSGTSSYLPVTTRVTIAPAPNVISYNIIDKLTHIFANGFGSRYDTNKYFCVMNETGGAPLVNVRGVQSYMSPDKFSGLVINNDGVFYPKRTDNTTTTVLGAVPSLVYMGGVNASGQITSKWAGKTNSEIKCQKSSDGKYSVTMDSLFTQASDYIVSVTPNGPGSLYITNQQANSFVVNNNSAVNVPFTFFVYNVRGMLK